MRRTKLLGVLLVTGLALAACGKDNNTSSADKTTTTKASDTTATTATAPGTGASTATVSVAVASGDVKAHLVGPNGHALYLFEKDNGTTSACTGACSATWPALSASGTPGGGSGVDAAKLSTADGQVQLPIFAEISPPPVPAVSTRSLRDVSTDDESLRIVRARPTSSATVSPFARSAIKNAPV